MIMLTILTCIMYLLANGFTYNIGTNHDIYCGAPLKDVFHDLLPDLSK